MIARPELPWSRAVRRLASPTLLVVIAGMATLAGALWETASVLRQAQRVHLEAAEARAAIAAETALAAARDDASWTQMRIADVDVQLRGDQGGYRLTCEFGGVRREFAAPWLPGGAPPALGRRRSSPDPVAVGRFDGAECSDAMSLPVLDPAALADAVPVSLLDGFHRDPGIALQWFSCGTDRDDYVWRGHGIGAGELRPSRRGGLMLVPGHLWVEPGQVPLQIELGEDLVVIVRGNLYLGRSLLVQGGGRLLLVTAEAGEAVAFADRDGSGHWSAGDRLLTRARFSGPVEGAGNAYLGLPGAHTPPIVCAAGLVVAGQLHVATHADVQGPLCLLHGITDLDADRGTWRLGSGEWTFRPGRERIPGFVTSGMPRPGLLQRILQEPLYPGRVAR